jgi:tetratricopeptide (TPR) repeat protein
MSMLMILSAALTAQPASKAQVKAKKETAPAAQAAAPQADPVQDYLKQPSNQGYLKARARLDTVLAKDPRDYKSLVLSFSVDRANLDDQVDKLYEVRDSLDAMSRFNLANYLLAAKDYVRAIALYDALNAKTPKWSCPWRHRGQALYQQGRLEDAEASLQKAVETRETHYDAYVWLARVQRDLKRYEDALETMKKAFRYKYADIEDPGKEVKADEDIKLMDELLLQNMVQPDQVVEERNKIIKANSKKK